MAAEECAKGHEDDVGHRVLAVIGVLGIEDGRSDESYSGPDPRTYEGAMRCTHDISGGSLGGSTRRVGMAASRERVTADSHSGAE